MPAQEVPANPVLTPVQTDVPGVELSMFVLDALGSKTHGYVAKPAREGKFPAHIQLQYAGVYALNAHAAAQRAADGWLFINVDSHDKLPSDPSGGVTLAEGLAKIGLKLIPGKHPLPVLVVDRIERPSEN